MGMEKVQIIKSMIETTANPIPQFVDSYKVNDETKSNRFSGLKRMKMGHTNSHKQTKQKYSCNVAECKSCIRV
jgi:hypothetical protein